jgi:hypothetical protein
MKRSPMKRTAFARKADAGFSSFRSAGKELQRTPMKKRARKKPTVADGSKYLSACQGEECYLRVSGVCQAFGWGSESVVPCHSNQSKHGKGGALKAQHIFTVPGCFACHAWIDQGSAPREAKFSTWDAAYERWAPVRARKMGIEQQQEAA